MSLSEPIANDEHVALLKQGCRPEVYKTYGGGLLLGKPHRDNLKEGHS
jgi:hypothetical protein